jgi:transcription initiation factor IIE alpha subunit
MQEINKDKNFIPKEILYLLKILLRYFYLDTHIVLVDFLLKVKYASEYSISKALNLKMEKIKSITNNLYKENFIRFEDRLFKKLKKEKNNSKQNCFRKVYKVRYWFIDSNWLIWCLRKKLNKILLKKNDEKFPDKLIYFICSRNICSKIYTIKDITYVPFDHSTGIFKCQNYLNQKVICGSSLYEKNPKKNLKNNIFTKDGGGTCHNYQFIIKGLINCYHLFSSKQ